MINLIVFSRDRACQLQALLDSIELHTKGFFNNIDIVYLATHPAYDAGYELLKGRRPYAKYFKESNFQQDIKSLLKMDYTCFFADDDLVYKDFNKGLFDMIKDDVACFSLRLGLNINYCYSNAKPNPIGEYEEDGEFIKFNWRDQQLDFGYPLSVVGHIFRTDEIKAILDLVDFINPNTMEAFIQRHLDKVTRPKMVAYKESKNFGVPANSVNQSWKNKNGLKYFYPVHELNHKYLNGEVIDVSFLGEEQIYSAQQEIEYKFK